MSIILSKTLQNYPVDGVDAFNIYEVNIKRFFGKIIS